MQKLNMVTKVKGTDQKDRYLPHSTYQVAHPAWADQDERPKKMLRREGT